MADSVHLYISAATDLQQEREILGRAVTEVPVSLGWRIIQSPSRDEPVEVEAVAQADLHLLLLGSDIRAPVGLEWQIARRAGRSPVPFLKRGILRTPAAQSFVRFLEGQASWQPFEDAAGLREKVLRLLARHLLDRAVAYALSPLELARLEDWRGALEAPTPVASDQVRGGAGESGVVLSPERFVPSEGTLIQTDGQPDPR
jgi:hypothetical protein